MQIGSKPSQRVFQAKRGGDKFIVLDAQEQVCSLYITVETLMSPRANTLREHANTPYFWAARSGVLYLLREVSSASYEDAHVPGEASSILAEMEEHVEAL